MMKWINIYIHLGIKYLARKSEMSDPHPGLPIYQCYIQKNGKDPSTFTFSQICTRYLWKNVRSINHCPEPDPIFSFVKFFPLHILYKMFVTKQILHIYIFVHDIYNRDRELFLILHLILQKVHMYINIGASWFVNARVGRMPVYSKYITLKSYIECRGRICLQRSINH